MWEAHWGVGINGVGVKARVQPVRAMYGRLEHRDPAGFLSRGIARQAVLGTELVAKARQAWKRRKDSATQNGGFPVVHLSLL